MRTICATLLCAMSLTGCSTRETPTSPTTPTPPVTTSPLPPADRIIQINVVGGSWVVRGGAPLQMSARIVTDSSPAEVIDDSDHVTWSSDPPGIVAIDSHGQLTGVGSGKARVIATVGSKSGFFNVRSVPDFTGTWSGNLLITGCSGAPDPRTCGRLITNQMTGLPNLYPFTLDLSQIQDRVTGTLHESSSRDTPLTGFVRESGALVLEGALPQQGLDPVRITNWSSTLDAAGTRMSGGFTKTSPGRSFGEFPFVQITQHEFSSVPRTP